MIIINNTIYLTILLGNFHTECKEKTLSHIEFNEKSSVSILNLGEKLWKKI